MQQSGQALQQPVPIPQAVPPVSQIQQAPWQPNYAATGPYTAAMQMERANTRMPTRDAYGNEIHPPLTQTQSFSSPGRGIIRPNLQDLSTFGSAAAAATNVPGQPPRYYELQHQQQQQHQAYRQSLYYQPQMQFNVPGGMPAGIQPPDPQFAAQQPYPQIFQQPTNLQQFYRPDASFNPYQPSLYGTRERDNPYWQSLDPNGETSYSSTITQNPQHSSSHGNAESFRFIRQINNNDVLCGRGGATNSHIGNRAFRHLVKQYKDKYLKAKKKEKPNVAGEIVDKIRSLDPPGRFLKKDRDTGYWLDIGDMRAKEKTSQALREGAPLIRRKLKEGALLADEEGGVTKESVDQDKPLIMGASETTSKEEDGKRKVISPVPQLPKMEVKQEAEQEESSSTPSPKRKKGTEPEKSSTEEPKGADKNDDDNASNLSVHTAPSAQNDSEGSENAASSDVAKKRRDEDDDSLTSLTPTKRKMSKVNERDLTQDERDLYFNVFDPPRGLKPETEEKVKSDEVEEKNEVPPKS